MGDEESVAELEKEEESGDCEDADCADDGEASAAGHCASSRPAAGRGPPAAGDEDSPFSDLCGYVCRSALSIHIFWEKEVSDFPLMTFWQLEKTIQYLH